MVQNEGGTHRKKLSGILLQNMMAGSGRRWGVIELLLSVLLCCQSENNTIVYA